MKGGVSVVKVGGKEQVLVSGYTINGEPFIDHRLQVGSNGGTFRDSRRYYKMTPGAARELAEALYKMADDMEGR